MTFQSRVASRGPKANGPVMNVGQPIWRRSSYRAARRAGLGYAAILLFFNTASVLAQAGEWPDAETANARYAASGDSSEPDPTSAHPSTSGTADVCGFRSLPQCLKDIGHDQLGLWTSPARLKTKDLLWLAPFAAATVIAFRTDGDTSQDLGFNPQRVNLSNKLSDVGSGYATVGFGAALWSIGALTHHDHFAETGRLGLEAIADAFLVDEAMKLATNRQRPYENLVERGEFWEQGTRGMTNSAFPSGHAITTWALGKSGRWRIPEHVGPGGSLLGCHHCEYRPSRIAEAFPIGRFCRWHTGILNRRVCGPPSRVRSTR